MAGERDAYAEARYAAENAYQTWRDDDGDGRDDATGLAWTAYQWQAYQTAWHEAANGTALADYPPSYDWFRGEMDRIQNGQSGIDSRSPNGRWEDNDGDGIHDITGERHDQWDARMQTDVQDQTTWVDEDGDSIDDRTGQTIEQMRAVAERYGTETSFDRGVREEDERQRAAAEEAERVATDEYFASGDRTRDLDAGRQVEHESGVGEDILGTDVQARDGTMVSGPYQDENGDEVWFDQNAGKYVPFDLLGSDARNEARQLRADAERERAVQARLLDYGYSTDDYTVNYEGYSLEDDPDFVGVDQRTIDAQMDALRSLQDVYKEGGLTEADRARIELGRSQAGQAARAQRDADLAALEARGMGGSGANQAARLSAGQGFTQSMADADLQMQIQAQQRALQAMTGAGNMAGQARGQSLQEGNAANDFNEWVTNRHQEVANSQVDARNKTGESRVAARKQRYKDLQDATAAASGVYGAYTSAQQDATERANDREDKAYGALGELTG